MGKAGLRKPDRIHFNAGRLHRLGDLLFSAMMEAYGRSCANAPIVPNNP